MTPLDTLKAGLKTAIVTLIVGSIGVFTTLLSGLNNWANDGDPPDLSNALQLLLVLLAATAIGVGNTVLRYVQVVAVPVLSTVIDKVLGAVPTYPESPITKVVDPS